MTEAHDDHDHEDLRLPLQLPSELMILGHRYHLSVVEDPNVTLGRSDAGDALGMTDLNRGLMRFRGGGEQSEDSVRDTLLHEVLHAVNYHMACDIHEDNIGRVATGLLAALRANPSLVAALISR